MPPEKQTAIFILFIGFITGFLFYHGVITSKRIKKYIDAVSLPENTSRNQVLVQRLTGFFSFFIIPVLLVIALTAVDFTELGLLPLVSLETVKFSLLIAIPLVLLSVLTSRSENNLKEYPQIRQEQWSTGLLMLSALTWVLYLFAYEFTFRGVLFFSLIEHLGLMPAIAVNAAIYALVHVPKSFREAVGSVPLGIVLCLAAWKTGNFMVAFISHCFLALSNEWLSLYHQPNMKLKRRTT